MNEYACPKCGWFFNDIGPQDPSIIEIKDVRNLHTPGSEIPGSAVAWTEVHKCIKCGSVYEFENSNY